MQKRLRCRDAILPSLLTLAIRIISISVASPKVAKATTSVSLSHVLVSGVITPPLPMGQPILETNAGKQLSSAATDV
jgi:hypothetical protein